MTRDRQSPKIRQIPLRLVLIVPFVLQIVGAVGLVGYLSYRSGQKAVEDIAKPLMAEIGDRIDQNLTNYLKKPVQVTRNNAEAAKLGILNYHDLPAVKSYFWKQSQIFDEISIWLIATEQKTILIVDTQDKKSRFIRIRDQSTRYNWDNYLTDTQGNYIKLIRRSTTYDPHNDPPENPWYGATKNAGREIWRLVVARVQNDHPKLLAAYLLPFFDQNNNFQGVINCSIPLSQLGDFLKKLKIGKTGEAFILEKNGFLIGTSTGETPFVPSLVSSLYSDKEKDDPNKYRLNAVNSSELITRQTTKKLMEHFGGLDQIKETQEHNFTENGKRYFVRVVPFKGQKDLDWLTVIVIPESDFLAEIQANARWTIVFCILTLFVATVIGILTARWITIPIFRLSEASQALALGEWQNYGIKNGSIEVKNITEISTLANSFNSMAHQLKTSFETLENRVEERTAELVIAKEKAEVANQVKSTFIANMSHELRSPLNAILGFSQLMLRTKYLPREQYENAGIIHRSGEYLLTLINNVLDFAKIEAGKTTLNQKDFDLYQLLDDLEDMLHLRAVNAGLELIFDRGENLPRYIHTDGVKLRQVLLNLLGNAIKFTTEGEVILSINSTKNEITEDYTLDFRVSDTGVGILPGELTKLFEAFAQTESGRDAQEGTGLGLAISRQFVQLMGGDITVESTLGKGTTFQFSIPVKSGEEISNNHREIREVLALAPEQPTYKLLTVDDKAINRQLLIKLLTPLGFEMKEASNGKDAIALWEDWEPHLIFMDMRMPIMDGYEATKYIKSTTKGNGTAVIALTASVLEEEKAIMLSAGCDDFVRKPFKESMIFETLSKHLGVKYIYEEIGESEGENVTETPLTSENLNVMSPEWVIRLSEAALEADTDQVMTLLREIPETEISLIKGLTKLVRKFQFEHIIDLAEPLINHES